jgi:hypothetical protein
VTPHHPEEALLSHESCDFHFRKIPFKQLCHVIVVFDYEFQNCQLEVTEYAKARFNICDAIGDRVFRACCSDVATFGVINNQRYRA